MRRYITLVLVLLSGCALFGTVDLAPTAKLYYDFMVGRGGNQRYSSFLSPAYKSQISPDDLQRLDSSFGSGATNTRFQPVRIEDVGVSVDGMYGLSSVHSRTGSKHSATSVRWIRVGKSWFLYMNSDAEISAYGHFPTDLPPPQFSDVLTGSEQK